MTTAREVMSDRIEYLPTGTSVAEAAKKLASADIGALPICDGDRLRGMITDRDIVIGVIAKGKDPQQTTVDEFCKPEVVTIGADDPIDEAIRTMTQHKVRRLPVIDGHKLVGMVSQADIAKTASDSQVHELVGAISDAP